MAPQISLPEALPASLKATERALEAGGVRCETIGWELLETVRDGRNGASGVVDLKRRLRMEGDDLERVLLWHAAARALSRLSSLRLDPGVLPLLEKDLRQIHTRRASLEAGSDNFNRAAKMATLRRFPAGPMEWEISGIPRSYALQAGFSGSLRVLSFVMTQLGGWKPCFFMHVAPPPRNRAFSVPMEVLRSYYRIARSLELQPRIRALVACAWFHDPAAIQDNPHLEVLSRPYLSYGGLIVPLRPAPPSSGILERNARRRDDVLAGRIHYRHGLAIWPRAAAIRWAEEHPEYGTVPPVPSAVDPHACAT